MVLTLSKSSATMAECAELLLHAVGGAVDVEDEVVVEEEEEEDAAAVAVVEVVVEAGAVRQLFFP